MLTITQAIILGLLQGVTELFPISSLGHSVLLPAVLHWDLDEHAPYFLVLLVATHLATALVLFFIFIKDWLLIAQGFLRSVLARRIDPRDTYAKLAWMLIIATIPAGLLGLLFQKKLELLFASPHVVAVLLILNGILLLLADRLRKRKKRLEVARERVDVSIARIGFLPAIVAGTLQALALLPGFSRTGASMTGGLLAGLDNESALRFSFLLATPIIFAAALLKLPLLLHPGYPVLEIGIASLAAAIGAFFSAVFLIRYFRTNSLSPFGWYCILAGILCLISFVLG